VLVFARRYGAYGFELSHKHMPEMALYAGLEREPLFQPAVGNFPQGMLVNVPLHYSQLAPGVTGARLAECLQQHYEGEPFVSGARDRHRFHRAYDPPPPRL
jgi:N-acetyl-gamma-glutamyl-phosphate reductase